MQDYCFHIHTRRCGHADEKLSDSDIAQYFYNAGFKTIAFTDHNPWKTFLDNRPCHAMPWSQKEEYVSSIRSLAEQYHGKMEIMTGFELEYIPENKNEMEELRQMSDIMIIGQHFTKHEDGSYESMHRKGFEPNMFEMNFYADCLENACKENYASILAHPDLYMFRKKEFGNQEAEIAERICQTSIKYEVPVEINLCLPCKDRFYEPCEITYPRRNFWQIAGEFSKLKVVVGLDYHGHLDPICHDEMFEKAITVIGRDTIDKLHFCSLEELKDIRSRYER